MSDDPFNLIGKRIASFQIQGLIGRGGMASVYYGWDANLQRPAAIKVIAAQGEDWQDYAKRLVSEARLIARWRHEHIVQIYSAGVEEGLYYFAMEFVEGLDLSRLLHIYHRSGELIPHMDVLGIGYAVAHALDYAHQQNVVHRDVKPSNILITGDNRVRLADFGLALDVASGTLGEVFGTPHYIAPEQARNSADAVPSSDLYSLGIVLYEMLTGVLPFDDPSPVSLAMRHVTDPPPMPSSVNPAIGIATEAVLIKALSKDPADRFPTGQALMAALDSALAQQIEIEGAGPPISKIRVAALAARHLETLAPPVTAYGGAEQEAVEEAERRIPAQTRERKRGASGIIVGIAAAAVIVGVLIVAGALILPGLIGPASDEAGLATPSPDGDGVVAAPSEEPSPTSALAEASAPPTDTPSEQQPSPSETPFVTAAPLTPLPTIAPTILYADGYRLQMIYDSITFYLYNPGSEIILINALTFEAIDFNTDQPTGYRFNGTEWAGFTPDLLRLHCDALEIIVSETLVRPERCLGFNAVRTPDESSPWIFWIARDNVIEFRVLWNEEEIGRCGVNAYECEVFIPPIN